MAIRSPGGAYLVATTVPADPLTAVLVLHGGPEHGTARCRWWLPQVLRCRLLAVAVTHQWPTAEQPAVYRLQHAWTGWDGDGRDPIADASWALAELGRRHPGIPVAILGHSMGGRVGVRLAGYPGVRGVVGLAPWLPSDDPVDQLAGIPVSVVQGTRDRELPATSTAEFLLRAHTAGALLAQIAVPGGGHAMIWRMRSWHRLAARQLAAILGR